MRRLRDRCGPGLRHRSERRYFDASQENAAAVVQAASTLPFGEGVRLVLVTSVGAWNKADKDLIVNYLAMPSETTCLALVGGGIRKKRDADEGCRRCGTGSSYEAPRPSNLPSWVQKMADERHLKMEPRAVRRLVTITGSNQRAILGELDKLATYLGRGKVGIEDIEELCWVSPEVRIWDLTDSLGARGPAGCFSPPGGTAGGPNGAGGGLLLDRQASEKSLRGGQRPGEGEDVMGAAAELGLKPFPARKLEPTRAATLPRRGCGRPCSCSPISTPT